MSRAAITTHILNLDTGAPAAGVEVSLFHSDSGNRIASAASDKDGRISQWNKEFELQVGHYRLQFAIGDWFKQRGRSGFYPEIDILFCVTDSAAHYHVPLLVNAYGYSTYRGS